MYGYNLFWIQCIWSSDSISYWTNFLTFESREDRVLFIGKLPPPPWKSKWAFTWVLGLQSGLILDCFDLWAIRLTLPLTLGVSRTLTWKSPRTLTECWLESCSTFDLGVNLGLDLWLSSRSKLWHLTFDFDLVSITPWLESRSGFRSWFDLVVVSWASIWAWIWVLTESWLGSYFLALDLGLTWESFGYDQIN